MDSFFPSIDGVVIVIDNLAKCMSKFADVTLVVPETSSVNEDSSRPYNVIRIGSIHIPMTSYDLGTPAPRLRYYKLLEKENFDIIHIHSPFLIGRLGINLAKRMDIPVVATMHTQFKIEFKRYLKSEALANTWVKRVIRLYNRCDKCIAVNDAIGKVFKNEYGYKKEPITISNGTDMTLIDNMSNARKIVNKLYNLKNSDIVFLFVGRINVIKNIMFTVEVLNILKQREFNFKMLFVGTGPDVDILKDKLNELNLTNDVIICGQITDRETLKAIYNRADLFIFPSLFDASSLVQVEAASQKTPTIFIEGAVTANTVTNNFNGFTAPNDTTLFANRIEEIFHNKELYSKVCENAYSKLYKNWDNIAKETYSLYLNLINERNK